MLWFEETNEEPTQILIARQSKLDKMTVSQSLKKLAAAGFVKRAEHTNDTRAKSVCLTAKGKALTVKLVPIIEKIDEKFFNVSGIHNKKILINILAKIMASIEK